MTQVELSGYFQYILKVSNEAAKNIYGLCLNSVVRIRSSL